MHGKFAAAKVSTFDVSDFCVVWDFDCQRLCITPQVKVEGQAVLSCFVYVASKRTMLSYLGNILFWAALWWMKRNWLDVVSPASYSSSLSL